MKVTYFKDTDTALLEFSDASGDLVSMTIEHAATVANLPQVSVEEIGESAP